jgi:hypothetical protein
MTANEIALEQAKKELERIKAADKRALKIIAEQEQLARNTQAQAAGQLVETVTVDRTGRKISTFEGPKSAWMDQFKSAGLRVTKWNTKGNWQ